MLDIYCMMLWHSTGWSLYMSDDTSRGGCEGHFLVIGLWNMLVFSRLP